MYQELKTQQFKPEIYQPIHLPSTTTWPGGLTSSSFSNTRLTINSTLADLPTFDFQVSPSAITSVIDSTFRRNTEIPGVLIINDQHLLGVISRRRFFECLGQLYGTAVYLKRPIELMLDSIGREWLHLTNSTHIYIATRQVFSRPERWVYEPIVVEFAQHTYRLLDVRDLLIGQTQLFANLQRELQQINVLLEERVKQRTAELAKINANLENEIDRRKQTEQALILTRDCALDASRFKTELLARVSHELRTPIGAILGFAEMLELGVYGSISGEQLDTIEKILTSSRYLENLVNDLLDQAQLSAAKFKLNTTAFKPDDLTQNVLAKTHLQAQKKNLSLTVKIAPDLPPTLLGDQMRLEQILVNLVNNAVKFTERGTVRINFYQPRSDQWAMQVADTGCGIPADAQTYIFEPFRQVDGSTTRQHGGTGLGLSIVKQLTELMNGQITLASELGHGSIFTVILPLMDTKKVSPNEL